MNVAEIMTRAPVIPVIVIEERGGAEHHIGGGDQGKAVDR